MRLNPRSTFPLMLAALTVWTCPARADPITAIYDVQVLERYFISGPMEPFSQHFELRMSFDPDSRDQFSIYGPPTFSSVPLTLPEPPADVLPLRRRGNTSHFLSESGGVSLVYADAFDQMSGRGDQPSFHNYVRNLQLFTTFVNPPLTLTAENFPAHLGTVDSRVGSALNFSFQEYECLVDSGEICFEHSELYLKSHVLYRGVATLREVESPVVPEPATLALVGGGLALLAAKRQRRGKQTRC